MYIDVIVFAGGIEAIASFHFLFFYACIDVVVSDKKSSIFVLMIMLWIIFICFCGDVDNHNHGMNAFEI